MDQQSIYQEPEYQQEAEPQPQPELTPGKESKYQPISAWGYVGIFLLMCVPCVGFIFMIVWAFGGCRKVNKRNFARAVLILTVINLVIGVIVGILVGPQIMTFMEENGITSYEDLEYLDYEETLDFSMLEAMSALKEGDFSVLEDLSEEELEVLSTIRGVDLFEIRDMYFEYYGIDDYYEEEFENDDYFEEDFEEDEFYDEDYEEEDYYEEEYGEEDYEEEDYEEEDYYEEEYDGWPEGYLPAYPSGDGEYVSATRTVFYDTTEAEMADYVEDLKEAYFEYEDFYDLGVAEEDVLTKNMWWGYDGYMYVIMYYEAGTLYIEHTLELPELDW